MGLLLGCCESTDLVLPFLRSRCGGPSLARLRILEGFVERNVEGPCDLERHLERWGVAALLDGDDGLPCDPDAVGGLRLRHLAVGEPESSNSVGDPGGLAPG